MPLFLKEYSVAYLVGFALQSTRKRYLLFIHLFIYIYVQLFKNVLCIYLPGGVSDWLGHWRKQKGIEIITLRQDPRKHRDEELIVIQRNISFSRSFTAVQTSCPRSHFPLVKKEEHKNIHASTHLKNLSSASYFRHGAWHLGDY